MYPMKPIIVIFCLFAMLGQVAGQSDKKGVFTEDQQRHLEVMEDSLAVFAYGMLTDTSADRRFLYCRTFIPLLVETLKTPHSFDYPFSELESISIQYPPDSSFRIFTWQLYVDADDYRYFGSIQFNQENLKLIPLVDRSFQVEDLEQDVLFPESWYGSVYYNIREAKGPQGTYYLLFGFDAYEFFRKRKVVDVLSFDQEGKPYFGMPVFRKEGSPQTKNRLLLEYYAEASVRLNYDEMLELLMYDHLIEMQGPANAGPVMVPDGSYEAYQLGADGYWYHQDKVFDQISEEAPRPFPVLDGDKDKDIFGNRKKSKNE